MRILYTSSEGQQFDFSTLSDAQTPRVTRIKAADFHKWEYWPEGTPLQYGLNVSRYTRDAAQYETQLYIYGTPAEREEFLESFHNAIMHDIALNSPGVLTWGDWQISAVVLSSDTYPHGELEHVTVNDLVFYCPDPRWMQPERHYFSGELEEDETEVSWSNEFPADFTNRNRTIVAPANFIAPRTPKTYTLAIGHHIPSDFTLKIYGPAVSPVIRIGDSNYGLRYSIPGYMYAEIDSRNHTVMLSDGTNLFNYRLSETSVFTKIGYGRVPIIPNGTYDFELTIFKESDEPRWSLYTQM